MKIYHKDKDYEKALKYYQRAAKFLPKHAKNYFKIGMCYYKLKDFFSANEAFEKALQLKPENEQWKKQFNHSQDGLVSIFLPQKLWWKEIIDTQAIIEKKGGNFDLYFTLANALKMMNRYEEATKAYEKAIKLCKENENLSELYYEMGFCYESFNAKDLAELAYKKAIDFELKEDKKKEALRYGIGVFHEEKKRFELANKAYLNKAQNSNEDEGLFFKIAKIFDTLYEWQNAEFYYEKSLEFNYQLAQTHFNLALVCERQKKYQKAINSYQEALKRNNDFKINWYYRLGVCFNENGQTQEAIESFLNMQRTEAKAYKEGQLKNGGFNQRALYTHYYENLELKDKTILYESFHGRLMSCNPYAIFKYLLEDERFKDFTHIWVLQSDEHIKKELKKLKNLILVKRGSNLYLRYLASAKYLINNTTFPAYFIRKEGQFYLNTWHGTPLKTLGKYIKTSFMEHSNTQRNFLQCTHIINPNDFTQKVLLKDYDIADIYSGKALVSGYARIDLTLKRQDFLKSRFDIKEGQKVLLYAPTYRGDFGNPDFDYKFITKLLEELCVMPFKVLFKGHHETLALIEENGLRIADANDRDIDTNELLSIVDILITDYSSIAFDFMPQDKPIIYYCYDYEKYKKERGMYFDLKDLGLSYCKNTTEVKTLLKDEVFLNQKNRYAHLKEKFFPLEDGHSTKRVVDFFFFDTYDEKRLFKNESQKTKLLFFVGPFLRNGILSAFKNLIAHLDLKQFSINVAIDKGSIEAEPQRLEAFNELKNKLNVLPKVGTFNFDIEEYWLMREDTFGVKRNNDLQEEFFSKAYQREFKRLFGDCDFDTIIQYDGYQRYWSALFAYAKGDFKKIIYAHNDMQGEFYKRFPYLRGIFYLYKRFDLILSVSTQTNEENIKNLAQAYEIPVSKFKTALNLINVDEVINKAQKPLSKQDLDKYFKKDHKVFINLARLSVEKDQTSLIKAFAKFHANFPKTTLLILGDGPLKDNLTELIKKLSLSKNVFLLGFISNPFPYLARSDFFILSSQHEGQALVLAEAMILRKPILCTNFSCAKDFLGQNNEYGLVVPKGEQGLYEGLCEITQNPPQFKEFDFKTYNEKCLKEFIGFLGENK